jgi:hypothetical protein
MAQPVESQAESMHAMQLDPSAQAPQAPSDTASLSTRTQAPRPAPSPVAAPQPQTGLEEHTPLMEEEGLVIISELEVVDGPPKHQEWKETRTRVGSKIYFPSH